MTLSKILVKNAILGSAMALGYLFFLVLLLPVIFALLLGKWIISTVQFLIFWPLARAWFLIPPRQDHSIGLKIQSPRPID